MRRLRDNVFLVNQKKELVMSKENVGNAACEAMNDDGVLRVVYVVRYEERFADEVSSGNFDYCYDTEDNARDAMLCDANGIAEDVEATVESGDDWAKVKCAGDEYKWFIDKMPIMGRD